jgi:hypothetical protein
MTIRKFNQDELLHVVDSHHGVYSYVIFAKMYLPHLVRQTNIVSYESLIDGNPYKDEHYFDIWAEGLCTEEFILDGKIYKVLENEGLYLAPSDMEIPDDWFI